MVKAGRDIERPAVLGKVEGWRLCCGLWEFNTEYTEGVFDERNWLRAQRDLTTLDFMWEI